MAAFCKVSLISVKWVTIVLCNVLWYFVWIDIIVPLNNCTYM